MILHIYKLNLINNIEFLFIFMLCCDYHVIDALPLAQGGCHWLPQVRHDQASLCLHPAASARPSTHRGRAVREQVSGDLVVNKQLHQVLCQCDLAPK
jgi:hypothetical protein